MRHIKIIKSISLIISLFLITSCSNNSAMKPEDFKNKEPRLIIEEYLSGNVKAWGVLQNRSGKVTRQFSADLNGTWDGKQLILKEKFNWDDGEVQDREWTINKIDEHNYEVTAGDVVGKAIGYSYGPAFKFEYVLLVPVKGKELKITFDDWIFKQDDRVAINRATMTKFGFKVATLKPNLVIVALLIATLSSCLKIQSSKVIFNSLPLTGTNKTYSNLNAGP